MPGEGASGATEAEERAAGQFLGGFKGVATGAEELEVESLVLSAIEGEAGGVV